VGVNAHELAHQWFGDMITARSETHHWLQESFATHYNMMYEREAFGQDYFDLARRNAQNAALNASTRDLYPIASSDAGSTRWYPKGAVVLEMLKYVVGREEFNRAINHYLKSHAYDNVDSEDLLIAFHETLGYSLNWFWEQWVYRGGEPIYQVNAESNKESTRFIVSQLQEKLPYVGLFKMPIVFEVHFTDGSKESKTVWISEKVQNVKLDHPLGKTVAYSLFDPGNQVIKAVVFNKPFAQLKQQALTATYMLDRLDAVIAMSDLPIDQKRDVLLQVFKKETFHAVREEVIEQLAKDKNKKSRQLVNAAFADADVFIRKAAVAAYDTIPKEFKATVEKLLSEPSYQLQEEVLNKLCLSFHTNSASYLEKTKAEMGNNAHNVRITWLKWTIKNGNTNAITELADLASVSFEFNTRRSALSLAKELSIFNEALLQHALEAARSGNNRMSSAGVGYLNWAYKLNPEWAIKIDAQLNTWNAQQKWEYDLAKKIRK
jgi:aminopeptidase N